MSLSSLYPLLGNLITYISLAENPGAPGGCESGGGLGGGLGGDSECDGSEGIISIFLFFPRHSKRKIIFIGAGGEGGIGGGLGAGAGGNGDTNAGGLGGGFGR